MRDGCGVIFGTDWVFNKTKKIKRKFLLKASEKVQQNGTNIEIKYIYTGRSV